MSLFRSVLGFIIWLQIGCATTPIVPQQKVWLSDQLSIQLGQPKDFFPPIKAVQLITAKFGEKNIATEVVLVNDGQLLKIVGIGPMGNTTFNIEYDGHEIRHSRLPREIKANYFAKMLADIIVVYSPAKQLSQCLPTDAKVVMSAKNRQIWWQGKKIIEVKYSDLQPWPKTVEYFNFFQHYHLTIQTLKVEEP